jgi:hypothetical protein
MGFKRLTLKAVVLFALGLSLSACSVKGNIDDITSQIKTYKLGQQTGLTSGSKQNEIVNGYRVSATVGDMSTGIHQNIDGYTVYGSVQGNISSETYDTTFE